MTSIECLVSLLSENPVWSWKVQEQHDKIYISNKFREKNSNLCDIYYGLYLWEAKYNVIIKFVLNRARYRCVWYNSWYLRICLTNMLNFADKRKFKQQQQLQKSEENRQKTFRNIQ